eukprot:98010_1
MSSDVELNCTTHNTSPSYFGILYGISQLSFLLLAAIVGFVSAVKTHQSYFSTLSFTDKVKYWFKSIYNKRSCYYPVIAHIFDQASDYMVVVEFYFLWQEEVAHGNDFCNGLDMRAMFVASVLILLLYRMITCIFIYQYTKSLLKVLLQFIDLEFVVVIMLNWKRDRNNPNAVQRWIQSMEAIFESAPQALLQFMFLLKTGQFQVNSSSWIVLFSFVFSMISLTSRIVTDEKYLFIQHAQSSNFNKKKCCVLKGKNAVVSDLREEKGYCCFMSLSFFIRVLYRLLDVSCHMFIYALFWLLMGAVPLFLLLCIDMMITLVLLLKYNMNNALSAIIATQFCRSTDSKKRVACLIFNIYRFSSHLICLLCITIIGYTNMKCSFCSDNTKLQYFSGVYAHGSGLSVFVVYTYSWCSFLITLFLYIGFYFYFFVFVELGVSNDRTIQTMKISGDIDGILDAIAYGYRITDEHELITSTLYYIKPNKDVSWYRDVVGDHRIYPYMKVLLDNVFVYRQVMNAIEMSPKVQSDLITAKIIYKRQKPIFNLESILRGSYYLKFIQRHLVKEYNVESLTFIISAARYKQYVMMQWKQTIDKNENEFAQFKTNDLAVPLEYNFETILLTSAITSIKAYAHAIYCKFIKEGSEREINLAYATKVHLAVILASETQNQSIGIEPNKESLQLFDPAIKQITVHLSASWARFIDSKATETTYAGHPLRVSEEEINLQSESQAQYLQGVI